MSLYQEWLKQLRQNEQQWAAFSKSGHTVVIAGPGSGKTRVLATKVAQLLREEILPPQGIACLTYTRMMARELEKRVHALGVFERPNIVIGTIHGFCLGYIVQPFAKLYGLEEVPDPIRIAPESTWNHCLDQARQLVSGQRYNPDNDGAFRTALTKYHLQHIDIPLAQWKNQGFAQILTLHYSELRKLGFVDFDLIIKAGLKLISNHNLVRQSLYAKFPWFAVDEYQDLGYPLFRIVTEMIDNTPTKLFAIGDPDQSIFDFAGTDPRYLLELAERGDMKPVIVLNKNYRSTKQMTRVCRSILTPYAEYESDKLDDEGVKCLVCELGENRRLGSILARLVENYLEDGIPINQIAILHKKRQDRKSVEDIQIIASLLEERGIAYVLDKHPLYDRSKGLITWLEDLAYWCLTGWTSDSSKEGQREHDFEALQQQWDAISAGQSSSGGERKSEARILLTQVLWGLHGKNMLLREWLNILRYQLQLDSVLAQYRDTFPDEVDEFYKLIELSEEGHVLGDWHTDKFAYLLPSVQLTTLHSSKGMEFEAVIIAGIQYLWNNENDQRLLYVGATRAKRKLSLLYTSVWPENKPRPPNYIQRLVNECNELDYFEHYPL